MGEITVLTTVMEQDIVTYSGEITLQSEGYKEMKLEYEWINPLSKEINLVIKNQEKVIKIDESLFLEKSNFEKRYKYIVIWVFDIIQTTINLYLNGNTDVLIPKKSSFKINKIGLDLIFLGIKP